MPTFQSAIDAAVRGVVTLDPSLVYTIDDKPAKITTDGLVVRGNGATVRKTTLNYASLVVFADLVRIENITFEGPLPPKLLTPPPQNFTGVTLPQLGLQLRYSANFYDCGWAQVVVAGDRARVVGCSFYGTTGIVFLPHRDARRARRNRVYRCRFFDYTFGIVAYGQESFVMSDIGGYGPIQPSTVYGPFAHPDAVPPGHLIYMTNGTGPAGEITAEECWSDDVVIRNVIEDIGAAKPISSLYTTLKLNSTHGLRIKNIRSIGIPSCLDFLGSSGTAENIVQIGGNMAEDPDKWATFRWAVVKANGDLAPFHRDSGTMVIRNAHFEPNGGNVVLYRVERPGLTLQSVTFGNVDYHAEPIILNDSVPIYL